MEDTICNKYKKTALALLCLSTIGSASVKAQSLEQAVAQALETHPDIRQSFAKFKSLEQQIDQASAGYLPTIDVTAGYGYEYTDTPGSRRSAGSNTEDSTTDLKRGEFGLSLKQMLFDGWSTSYNVERTTLEAHAEQWTLFSTAEDLALAVSQAYLNSIKTEQLLALSDKNIESHQEIYEQIKERTDSGFGSVADLSQVTGRLARAQSNNMAARNNLRDATSQYKRLTQIQPSDLVIPVPDADMLPVSLESGLSFALSNHPVIKSAGQDIKAARAYKAVTEANYYPQISVELNANANNDIRGEDGDNSIGSVGGHSNDFSAMVKMRFNLYAGGENRAQQRGAAYQINIANEINQGAHRQVIEGFELAWNAYEVLGSQMQFIQQHVVAAKETQIYYEQQFKLGQRSLLDLLDTENELFKARQDYLDAQFNELSARYRLLNASGLLLDSLRVTRSSAWQGEHTFPEIKSPATNTQGTNAQ